VFYTCNRRNFNFNKKEPNPLYYSNSFSVVVFTDGHDVALVVNLTRPGGGAGRHLTAVQWRDHFRTCCLADFWDSAKV